MKNNILYTFILLVSVVAFTACGSDSKKNPIAPVAPVPVEPYTFFNATTPLIITKAEEVNGTIVGNDYNISVQLLNHGLVEIGAPIQMKPFDFKYGNIEASIVDTDENGVATFKYLAPTDGDYNVIKGKNVVLEAIFVAPDDETNTTIEDTQPPKILLTQPFVLQFH